MLIGHSSQFALFYKNKKVKIKIIRGDTKCHYCFKNKHFKVYINIYNYIKTKVEEK